MTKEQVKKELEGLKESKAGHYYIATKAYHQLGDISRKGGELMWSENETHDFYVGIWITGMGFTNVLFPKKKTRRLTKEEIEKYSKSYVQLSDHAPQPLDDID